MIWRISALLKILVLSSLFNAHAAAEVQWHDSFFPYRISLKLPSPTTGQVQLDLPVSRVVELLQAVALEPISEKTLAFDRAILVDRGSGQVVGGFKLVPAGAELAVEGDFAALSQGEKSRWVASAGNAKVVYEPASVGTRSFPAMRIENQSAANDGFKQPLKLEPGRYYLFEYQVNASMQDGYAKAAIYNPAKWFFPELPGSYAPKLTPDNRWTRQQVLYQPDVADCELRIDCGFTGKATIGDIRCRPVNWALVADLPAAADTLDLYLVGMGGHFYVQPTDAMKLDKRPERNIAVTPADAELANLNPEGVLLSLGDNMTAWTIPPHLPLRAEKIGLTRPRAGDPVSSQSQPYRATVLRGQSTTILLAVETGGTHVTLLEPSCSLPVTSSFLQIASLDLFDTYFPNGKRVESRYDPMVELNFPLTPPDRNGVHVVACTLAAGADAVPGTFKGEIKMRVRSQVPREQTLVLPVELTILPPGVSPLRHFGAIMGAQQLTGFFEKGGPFERDSTTIAQFHGYKRENLKDTFISRLSRPDAREPQKAVLVPLAWKYFNSLLDFNIVPQGLTLFSFYDYEIVNQGDDKAPKLTNWNFVAFDKAVDEFAVRRNVPNLVIWHTNGHLMEFFHLADGSVYSIKPKSDTFAGTSWHQIPRDEYLKLLGDYFDTICEHLDKKGLADRAAFVIDESDETTYQLMYDIRMELKSRPFANKARWSHTTYKTSIYTHRLPDGRLLMDEVLDFPMPNNDEHFNFVEAEWYSRMKIPEKSRWVYYVETEHMNLDTAGLSTVITPLKLRNIGVHGWFYWAAMLWSIPYKNEDLMGVKYPQGAAVNPWLNPYYNHGPGGISFFYPPDPRGPADEPTNRIIPSYRLHLIRDGIQDRTLLDVLTDGKDDAGAALKVDARKLGEAEAELRKLWTGNPVQWYLSPESYRKGKASLYEACQ